MKKIFTTAIVICVGAVLMAQTSVNLKLNLEKDKTYRIKSTSEQNSTYTVMGNTQQSESKTKTSVSIKPITIGTDFIIANIQFDTTITKTPQMEINSTKPGSISSGNMTEVINYIYSRFSNVVFNVKLSLSGKVLEISNIKEISHEFTQIGDSLQGQLASQKEQFVQMASEATIKGTIESIIGYLPGKLVNIGDKWDSNIAISGSGMSMAVASNYKLKKLNGNQAEISGESTIEPSSKEPGIINGMPMKYDIRGLGKSTINVDIKTGWVIKTSSKTHLQGNMTVTAQGNEMQIPLEVDSFSEVVALP